MGTAGMSFRFTINDRGDFGCEHTEKCYTELVDAYETRHPHDGHPFVSTFLRAPRAHVYSQFLECKYDNWGKRVTKGTEFPRSKYDHSDFSHWVSHFYNSWNKEDDSSARVMTEEAYHCYHPYNMQCRALSDNCNTVHYLEPGEAQSVEDMEVNAKNNMLDASFVGIVELYDASMCLFWIKSKQQDNIDDFCNPNRQDNEGDVTHHVPPHSIDDIQDSVWHRVDAMTKYDSLLYYNGLVRFIQEFDDVGFKHNVSISDFNGNMEPLYVTINLVKQEFGNMKYISWIKDKLAGVKNVPH